MDVPLRPQNLVGITALRHLLRNGASPEHDTSPEVATLAPEADANMPLLESLSALVDELAPTGHGVILTMGKGGVGKTTLAAAIATELAHRGFPVHLSTTDPAAHVAMAAGANHQLEISRIDPQAETRQGNFSVGRGRAAWRAGVRRHALLQPNVPLLAPQTNLLFRLRLHPALKTFKLPRTTRSSIGSSRL